MVRTSTLFLLCGCLCLVGSGCQPPGTSEVGGTGGSGAGGKGGSGSGGSGNQGGSGSGGSGGSGDRKSVV